MCQDYLKVCANILYMSFVSYTILLHCTLTQQTCKCLRIYLLLFANKQIMQSKAMGSSCFVSILVLTILIDKIIGYQQIQT